MAELIKDRSQYWGSKFGSFSTRVPKGASVPWGNVIDIPRGSAMSRAGGVHSGASGYKLKWYHNRVIKKGK